MRITFDNGDGLGAVDYTGAVDRASAPVIERKLNQPSTLRCGLLADARFVIPQARARVVITKNDGTLLFTGYLVQAPTFRPPRS